MKPVLKVKACSCELALEIKKDNLYFFTCPVQTCIMVIMTVVGLLLKITKSEFEVYLH